MKRLILQIYDFLSAHKALAGALALVLLALSLFSASRLHFQEDIAAFLPDSPETARYREVYARLGQDKEAVFFQGGTLEERLDAMYGFEALWAEADTDGLVTVQAAADQSAVLGVMDFLSRNAPYFLEAADYQRIDSLLSVPGYIDAKLEEDRNLLYGAGSSLTARFLRADPLGLYSPVLQRLEGLNPNPGQNRVDGCLFTEDGETGLLLFASPWGGSESGRNATLVALLDSVKTRTMREHPAVRVSSTGGPEVAVENAVRIRKDSLLAICLAAVLICILLWFSYKRFPDVLWILLSISAGAAFALGLIALFKSSVSVIVLGIGCTIIGIAVNYPLHYVDHLKYQQDKRRALAEQVNPLLVGNITTVAAFAALLLMKAEALRDFGFIGAMMLVGTILFVLIFLPVFVPAASRPRNTLKLDLDRHISLSPKGRKLLFCAFLLVTIVLGLLGRSVSFDADMHHINYMTPEQEAGFSVLGAMEGDESLYLVAEGADFEEALSADKALRAALPEGERAAGIGLLLPIREEQQERLLRWQAFQSAHPDLGRQLQAAALEKGFTQEAFRPFLESLEKPLDVQERAFFAPLTDMVGETMVQSSPGKVQLVSYWKVPAAEAAEKEAALRAVLPAQCFCFRAADVQQNLVGLLSGDFDRIGWICSLVVFLFLLLSFGSLELSITAFLPLALSWLWILGIMRLSGLQFNIVNIILASFIFGMGDDYTIFITEGLMYERATGRKILHSYKNAVVLSALVMFIGLGALVVARHPAMRSLGQVTVVGMFTVVVMAYYLPPLVFRFLTSKKDRPRKMPLTLKQLLYTVGMFLVFLAAMLWLSLRTWLLFLGNDRKGDRSFRYHCLLQRWARAALRFLPGCPYSLSNPSGESFEKPAMLICNHQSHLDVLALMAVHPKLVMLTNEWVWNSPFYGYLVRHADCCPAVEGLDSVMAHLRKMVAQGYSVAIFPEGTRSEDCQIQRFHRGAFLAAKELGLDIVPLYIHGFGYALPKHDFMLRKAAVSMEIGPRIPCAAIPEDLAAFTRGMRHQYQEEYARIRREKENAVYMAPFVRYRYLYKGHDAAVECRRVLRKKVYAAIDALPAGELVLQEVGCGVYALLVALARPDINVTACEPDEEKYLTALRCEDLPANLTYLNR